MARPSSKASFQMGCLHSEKLFTPDESAYLDYMFNDATFSNS